MKIVIYEVKLSLLVFDMIVYVKMYNTIWKPVG